MLTHRIDTLRVGDIMVLLESYPCVEPAATLLEAVAVLESKQIEVAGERSLARALLVMDARQRLVGVVRRRDIMRGLETGFLRAPPAIYRQQVLDVGIDPSLVVFTEQLAKRMRARASTPVCEVMRPVPAAVDVEDHIIKAVCELLASASDLLPVTRRGRVVGVVRSVELFRELAHILVAAAALEPDAVQRRG